MGEDAKHPHLSVLKILLEGGVNPSFRFENTFGEGVVEHIVFSQKKKIFFPKYTPPIKLSSTVGCSGDTSIEKYRATPKQINLRPKER